MADRIRIRQVKSGSNAPRNQRRTLRALGLRRHQDQVVHVDRPTIRGMIDTVSHLVEVDEIGRDDEQ